MHSASDLKPIICGACKSREIDLARIEHLEKLDALPIEERLRRVETWIYDYRPRYVSPPKF